jgi:hypothetical protein
MTHAAGMADERRIAATMRRTTAFSATLPDVECEIIAMEMLP